MREAEPVLYWRVKVYGEWKFVRANWKPLQIRHIGDYEFVYECDLWPPEVEENESD